MKRILFIFAVAAVFTACNKPTQSESVQQDTVVVESAVVIAVSGKLMKFSLFY